jgi:hypothetical protein
MAALFPKIYDLIDQNPNKHTTLRCHDLISTEGSLNESTQWGSFSVRPLDPPGILSLLLSLTDPMYELGTNSLRKQILREQLIPLHERIDKELIGRRYPRKKIQDLLANQVTADAPVPSAILNDALAELFQVQIVHIDRRTKKLSFSPPDPRTWQSDRSVYLMGDDYRWIFQPLSQVGMSTWLSQREDEGWSISWPTAEGKFEDLKAMAVRQNLLSLNTPKEKKDDLAKRMGRNQSLAHLSGLSFST